MEYKQLKTMLLNSTATPDWIIETILKLDEQDIVDVLNDLELLRFLFEMKFKEHMANTNNTGKSK